MRIVSVNSCRWWGGAEVWYTQFCRGMAERGHEVTLACHPDSELHLRLRNDARLRVVELPIRGELNPARVYQLWRYLRTTAADVVTAHRPKDLKICVAAARLSRGVSVVHTKHYGEPLKGRIDFRLFWRGVSAMTVSSQTNYEVVRASAPWLGDLPITTIPNGIDTKKFRPSTQSSARSRSELGLPSEAIVVSYHGRLAGPKRVDLVIDAVAAAANDSPVHGLIIGEGAEEKRLRELASRLSAPITFAGFRDNVPELLGAVDISIHMSEVEGGTPLSVLEAMACGLPVVASDTTSHPELISDGVHGCLVTPGHSRGAAAAIRRLAADATLRHQLGRAARQRAAAEFGVKKMLDRYEAALEEVVHDSEAGR